MQKVKEDGTITIDELKQFDKLLAEFNNKFLEIKFTQTKKIILISDMSTQGTFKLNEKETNKINY